MWDNPRQLNAVALAVLSLALRLSRGRRSPGSVRQPAVRAATGRGRRAPVAVNPAHLEAVVREELRGTFFHHAARRRRAARCSGCHGCARSRCVANGRIDSKVSVTEHTPLARWNDNALVNTQGEVFIADYDGELPQFTGPEGPPRK
jgi:hypothetical protein